jgi:hypothetical protein
MRVATASAIACRSTLAATRPNLAWEAKSAEMVIVVMARRLCPNGQAAWRSVGPASEGALAIAPMMQA